MEELLAAQRSLNRGTEGHWNLYAEHRERVAALLSGALMKQPSTGARLAILGAGNCNDLDLGRIVESGSELHLVDCDEEAMVLGLERQGLDRGRVTLHGHVDLSAVTDRAVTELASELGGAFHVVASTTLLTQLIQLAVDAVDDDHPDLTTRVLTLRNAHLRLVARLLRPGGIGVVVTDVVSSDTLPELHDAPTDSLDAVLQHAVITRNFFTGTNPYALLQACAEDTVLRHSVADVALRGPWRWQVSPKRCYLVVALSFRRTTSATRPSGRSSKTSSGPLTPSPGMSRRTGDSERGAG